MTNFSVVLRASTRNATMAVFAAIVASSSSAWADNYVAVSDTAMSVTGDIALDDFAITFANGKSLTFASLVSDQFVVGGESVPASVYKVARPSDPVLENGNRLCGSGKVTYIASWAGEGTSSVVAVFTGGEPPSSDEAMCASYTYDLPDQ